MDDDSLHTILAIGALLAVIACGVIFETPRPHRSTDPHGSGLIAEDSYNNMGEAW